VVFPAYQSGVNNALTAYKGKGFDVSAFTEEAVAKEGTFVYPVVDFGVKTQEIMTDAFDNIFLGKVKVAEGLIAANKKVNALFK